MSAVSTTGSATGDLAALRVAAQITPKARLNLIRKTRRTDGQFKRGLMPGSMR